MAITITHDVRPLSKPQVHTGNTSHESAWPTEVRNAEASELGLKPGVWPQRLTTDLGNRQDFVLERVEANGTRVYSQANGLLALRVFND